MATRTRELWDYLNAEPDEKAVLSAAFEKTDTGLTLRCASLLIGPPEIANGAWPAWRLLEGHRPTPNQHEVESPGSFSVDLEHAVAGRVTLGLGEALDWARASVEQGESSPVGPLPAARVALAATRAPIRVTTNSETDAGDLAVWLARPIIGFHFPRADSAAEIEPPERWQLDDQTYFSPAMSLLGMSWFRSKTGPPPSGLLLGRFERRAWLSGQHLRPEDSLYDVRVGFEPDRVELADLELDVEERVGEEIVISERLRFEDLDLRATEDAVYRTDPAAAVPGRPILTVSLPTLGRKTKRTVRLHHRDGTMLDAWPPFNLVESIGMTLVVNGTRQPTRWTGDRREAPNLVELLGAVERIRSQYATMRRGGLAARLFDDYAHGRKGLRSLIERAPGQLLVMDPWLADWALVDNLPSGPARVLIGPDAKVSPPPQFNGQIAQYDGSVTPFHDRFFLWEGGGVTVGTSAGSVRQRLFRIVRIGAVEADELRTRFMLWWSDPQFRRIL